MPEHITVNRIPGGYLDITIRSGGMITIKDNPDDVRDLIEALQDYQNNSPRLFNDEEGT